MADKTPSITPPSLPSSAARFLSPRQVAEILGVHYVTVKRLIQAGKLRAVRVGRLFRISQADLNAYIRGNQTND